MAADVRAAVAGGAESPDFFSTRPSAELQAILRDTQTLPIENLANTGAVRIDFVQEHIFRDSFWKGSFAKDTLVGWEERARRRQDASSRAEVSGSASTRYRAAWRPGKW